MLRKISLKNTCRIIQRLKYICGYYELKEKQVQLLIKMINKFNLCCVVSVDSVVGRGKLLHHYDVRLEVVFSVFQLWSYGGKEEAAAW